MLDRKPGRGKLQLGTGRISGCDLISSVYEGYDEAHTLRLPFFKHLRALTIKPMTSYAQAHGSYDQAHADVAAGTTVNS